MPKRSLCVGPLFFALIFALAPAGYAQQQVTSAFEMPAQLQATVSTFECANAPGPEIVFDGVITLGGLTVQFTFRNNINRDVHVREEEVTVEAVVIAPDHSIVLPKQPVLGGVGGNPFIWLQLVDSSGDPLTSEIFLGRCVQGPVNVDTSFFLRALASALVEVLDCTNNPGPFINLSGQMSIREGVTARFIFRNNDNPVGGPHEAQAVADVVLIPAGFAIEFPKQPVQGGVGGNPWISVRFLHGNGGEPMGTETLLGRCVQLMPGN